MKLKQFVRYEMNFTGFAANVCAGSIGLSFFLRILYYFGLVNLKDIGAGETFFFLILPLLVSCVFIILFRVVKWNAPGFYAILGAAICLILLVLNFSSGDVLLIILSLVLYPVAAVALLGTAGGYFPNKLPVVAAFALILTFRLFLNTFELTEITDYVPELADVAMIISLFALPLCFKSRVRGEEPVN